MCGLLPSGPLGLSRLLPLFFWFGLVFVSPPPANYELSPVQLFWASSTAGVAPSGRAGTALCVPMGFGLEVKILPKSCLGCLAVNARVLL